MFRIHDSRTAEETNSALFHIDPASLDEKAYAEQLATMSTMRRGSKTVIDNEQRDFLSDVTDQTGLAAYYWQLQEDESEQEEGVEGEEDEEEETMEEEEEDELEDELEDEEEDDEGHHEEDEGGKSSPSAKGWEGSEKPDEDDEIQNLISAKSDEFDRGGKNVRTSGSSNNPKLVWLVLPCPRLIRNRRNKWTPLLLLQLLLLTAGSTSHDGVCA
jgi:hypothetical protein